MLASHTSSESAALPLQAPKFLSLGIYNCKTTSQHPYPASRRWERLDRQAEGRYAAARWQGMCVLSSPGGTLCLSGFACSCSPEEKATHRATGVSYERAAIIPIVFTQKGGMLGKMNTLASEARGEDAMDMICLHGSTENTPGPFCADCGAALSSAVAAALPLSLAVPSYVETPPVWEKALDLILVIILALSSSTCFVLWTLIVQRFFQTPLLTVGVSGVSLGLGSLLARMVYRYGKVMLGS